MHQFMNSYNYLAIALVLVMSAGCGVRTSIKPDPKEVKIIPGKQCPPALYLENTSINAHGDKLDPAAGGIGKSFFETLEKRKMFDALYYSHETQEEILLKLKSEFTVDYDRRLGSGLGKAAITGCFLCLPAPVVWYNENLFVTAKIDIYDENKIVETIETRADAVISYKVLSEGQRYDLQSDAFNQAKTSVFRQLVNDINRFCTRF